MLRPPAPAESKRSVVTRPVLLAGGNDEWCWVTVAPLLLPVALCIVSSLDGQARILRQARAAAKARMASDAGGKKRGSAKAPGSVDPIFDPISPASGKIELADNGRPAPASPLPGDCCGPPSPARSRDGPKRPETDHSE